MNSSGESDANEVCLVDDDSSVLRSMQYLLAAEELAVRAFSKPEDFLAYAARTMLAVVVLDIWMAANDRLGSASAPLLDVLSDARNRHHGARRSGRARDRAGNRPRRLFH